MHIFVCSPTATMIRFRIFKIFLPDSGIHISEFIVFKLWNLSIFLPSAKYDADGQIFKFQKNSLRIILSVLFFCCRIMIIWWGSKQIAGDVDKTVHNLLSTLSMSIAVAIIIIYRRINGLEIVQNRMKEIFQNLKELNMDYCQNDEQNISFLFLYFLLFFLMFFIDTYVNLKESFYRVSNSVSCLFSLFIMANVIFFYACILNDIKHLFRSVWSCNQNFYDKFRYKKQIIQDLLEITIKFSENFSSIMVIAFTMDFALLIGSMYWITFSLDVHSIFQAMMCGVCYLWWINAAYKVLSVTFVTANIEKEVS